MNWLNPLDLKSRMFLLLLLLWLLTSLLNTNTFGPATLTAYFGFSFFSILLILLVSLGLVFQKKAIKVPVHVQLFLILVVYILLHGIATNTFNLIHYYWAISALFLITLQPYFNSLSTRNYDAIKIFLLKGISALVVLEGLIVIAQWLKIISSGSSLFPYTGTWQNPNVTAMFLAMGLYSVLQIIQKRKIDYCFFFIILIAIVLLNCRTAYLISLLLIVGRFWKDIQAVSFQKLKLRSNILLAYTIILFVAIICVLGFYFKWSSTTARLKIWESSLSLIAEKPLTGHGFGLFEKYYNSYIAKHPSLANDHAFMAYNDFLELGVEGGLIAVGMWLAFTISLFIYNVKNQKTILPGIAFLFMQLTNFGFQAIPAFALFLLYTAIEFSALGNSTKHSFNFQNSGISFSRITGVSIFVLSAFCLFRLTLIAKAFNEGNRIVKNASPSDAVSAFADLNALSGFEWYHENYGDAFIKIKEFEPALTQYKLALLSSSSPDLFSKCGFCFQQLAKYDSSEYYYTLSENIEPYMFTPRMALLLLYQQKGDTINMLHKAEEIIKMPMKVKNEQVYQMKDYASKMFTRK